MMFVDKTPGARCVKIIDDCGLEAIAKERSCSGRRDGLSVFLDSSIGCDFKCSYCWLTRNKTKYIGVGDEQWHDLFNKLISKLEELRWTDNRNLSVKFMGQGDPFGCSSDTLNRLKLIEKTFVDKNLVLGGISYSSIFPNTTQYDVLRDLFNKFEYPFLPRVYTSVGSFVEEIRAKIFPKAHSLESALEFCSKLDVDLRLHWTPINIISNYDAEMERCFRLLDKYNISHVRLIPYNPIDDNDKIRAYNGIQNLMQTIRSHGYKCDMLVSSGHSINAACGMFSSKQTQLENNNV